MDELPTLVSIRHVRYAINKMKVYYEPDGRRTFLAGADVDMAAMDSVVGLADLADMQLTYIEDAYGVSKLAVLQAIEAQLDVGEKEELEHKLQTLGAGSSTQTVLPLIDLRDADGVAVDGAGSVYVADSAGNRVLTLVAGPGTWKAMVGWTQTQALAPLVGLDVPAGVAVDTAGNIYVADTGNNRVVKRTPKGTLAELRAIERAIDEEEFRRNVPSKYW
jgi:hypothetical protein